MSTSQNLPLAARYTWGGDEFLFVEIAEEMSLASNLRVMAMAGALAEHSLDGIVDICPANASLLVRFDPDVLAPADLRCTVEEVEIATKERTGTVLSTRIVEVPVWYDDPYTREVAMRFREGYHQAPAGTDLDYAARVNNLAGPAEFIQRHHAQPWIVSMVGFVAGLPFLFQLVEREHQLEVSKYLSPRTDTPRLTVGHGGCFGCIYSVRGAGGYQMFGTAAAPVFDPTQSLPDFIDSMVFFRPGDIVKFVSITQEDYRRIGQEVDEGTFRYRSAPVEFDVERAVMDPEAYNATLLENLYAR
ncbi:allophanate hydrolase subunit 1 [Amycolatopsis azurea]|uniref:5-oxoprolinase subunit B family protein n=1 Tax=Amycolatopsis azurea TaxID=36819 RepID=UPI0037FF229B